MFGPGKPGCRSRLRRLSGGAGATGSIRLHEQHPRVQRREYCQRGGDLTITRTVVKPKLGKSYKEKITRMKRGGTNTECGCRREEAGRQGSGDEPPHGDAGEYSDGGGPPSLVDLVRLHCKFDCFEMTDFVRVGKGISSS